MFDMVIGERFFLAEYLISPPSGFTSILRILSLGAAPGEQSESNNLRRDNYFVMIWPVLKL